MTKAAENNERDREIHALQTALDQAVKEVSEARKEQRAKLVELAKRVRQLAIDISKNITEE